jgi:hypothetical protein
MPEPADRVTRNESRPDRPDVAAQERYVASCVDLIDSFRGHLDGSKLDSYRHLVEHNEAPIGIAYLARALESRPDIHISANIRRRIRDAVQGTSEEPWLPESFRDPGP